MSPTVVSFSTAISACAKGGEWQRATRRTCRLPDGYLVGSAVGKVPFVPLLTQAKGGAVPSSCFVYVG